MTQYQYNTYTAEGFDEIYGLGHDAATTMYRTSILSGAPALYPDQMRLDAASLQAAKQFREQQQASVPNFTDDDERFDAAWAAGFVVATVAEQDAYLGDPDGYRAELLERYAPRLPEQTQTVVDAEPNVEPPSL